MKLTTINYGEISFVHSYSSALPVARIPNSEPYMANMPYGKFFFQKVETHPYSFWQHYYQANEDLLIHAKRDGYWCGFRWMLKNHIHHYLVNGLHVYLKQGQFNFLYAPRAEASFNLRAGQEYHVFDMWVSLEMLTSLGVEAQVLDRFLQYVERGQMELMVANHAWVNAAVLDALAYLLKYPYEGQAANHLLRQIIQAAEYNQESIALSEQQVEDIYQARETIINNLSVWPGIASLAKSIHLNEFTFKRGFKQVFGLSPYQYAKYERLNTSRRLLRESHLSLAEIAQQVGFDSVQTFGTAFKKRFHTTALQYRKNGGRPDSKNDRSKRLLDGDYY